MKLRFGIICRHTVFFAFLFFMAAALLLKTPYSRGEDTQPWEQEPFDTVLASFQDLAKQSVYDELDEAFTQLGTDITPIEKTAKILEVIDKLEDIRTCFEKIIAAEPSQQASIDFLSGVATGLNLLADVPVPLAGQFFKFYAWEINECVSLLNDLHKTVIEKCIMAVQAADLDFAVYIAGNEAVEELLRKKEQEDLARKAAFAVKQKKASLERRRTQIESLCPVGDPLVDSEKGFTRFVQDVVAAAEKNAGHEGSYDWTFDYLGRSLRKKYSAFFELTAPRDLLEEQYSGWIEALIGAARTTVADTQAHLPFLRQAADRCSSAERAISYIEHVIEAVGENADYDTRNSISEAIGELRNQINGLRGGITAGQTVAGLEEALQRLQEISTDYNKVLQAEALAADAAGILQQALDLKQAMLTKLQLFQSQETPATPYRYISSSSTKTLSADPVAEAVLGYPRSVEPLLQCPTVSQHIGTREVTADGEPRLETYYYYVAAGLHTAFDVTASPEGIVAPSLESITGLSGGYATVKASTAGYPGNTVSTGVEYDAPRPLEVMEGEISYDVHEFTGIALNPQKADLFVPSTEWDWADGEELVFSKYSFRRDSAYEQNPEEVNMEVETSDGSVVGIEDGRIIHPYNPFGSFNLVAGQPGQAAVTFHAVDGTGIRLAGQGLDVTSNTVRVFAGPYSLENVPLETTADGIPIHRVYAWAHAGEIMELKVVVDGPMDMSGYECQWSRRSGGTYPEMESAVTAFVENTSTNYLLVPAAARPGTAYWMDVSIRPSGSSIPVFQGAVPGIQVLHARLGQVSLFVGFAEGEEPRLLNELHLFSGRTGYRPTVEIFPAPYFTDEPNNSITKDVYRTVDYVDTVAWIHKYTSLMHIYGILQSSQITSQNDYFHFITPGSPGTTTLFSSSWAYSNRTYVDNNKGYVRSANALQVYSDPIALEGSMYDRKVIAGEIHFLRLNVDTEGNLGDYECLWTLEPDVGGLESQLTEFVQDDAGNWYSENPWLVPAGQEGQEVQVDVVIRYRGSEKELGRDLTVATVISSIQGDVNTDGSITLADAVLILKMLSGYDTDGNGLRAGADVNGDHLIGLEEAVYVLQKISD